MPALPTRTGSGLNLISGAASNQMRESRSCPLLLATTPPHRAALVAYVVGMDFMQARRAARDFGDETAGLFLEEVNEGCLSDFGCELRPHLVVLVRGLELFP